ncbi:MAG: chemotaxis protein CheW [Singulisphaera sp.]
MLALTFQIENTRLALDVRRISRVVPRVPLERPAGSPDWLAGVFVYEQAVVPVVDVHRLLGAGDCPHELSSRIILVPWPRAAAGDQGWLGLLAARVSEIRDVPAPPSDEQSVSDRPELGPAIVDRDEILRVVDLERLLPPEVREHISGVCSV